MSALTQALESSQAKAVAALGKAYVRRTDDPDDELFAGLLHKIGLDDDVAIQFLLAAWSVLREEKATAPAEVGRAYVERVTTEPATERQWERIKRDCNTQGVEAPNRELSKADASQVIEQLKAGSYDAANWTEPF